ncbi:MAG: hypothetical protein ABSG91_18295 [Syntrophobacteraceae bacterium]
MEETNREILRLQEFIQSEDEFAALAADKDEIMEMQRQVLSLPIEKKKQLLQGLVAGDIEIKPPTPDAKIDITEGPNALNGWTTIPWKFNKAIILDILGGHNTKRSL